MDGADRISRTRMRGLGLWDPKQPSPHAVVVQLTAMQSQEHAFARWSVAQRVAGGADATSVDRAFDEGHILRTHVLRPTWHYVSRTDLRWLMALSGPRILARTARRRGDLGLDDRTLSKANDLIADKVAGEPQTRRDLADALEHNRVSVDGQRLAYIVMHAELTGVICSGPMRGKQHTYAAFDERVAPGRAINDDEAIAKLTRRYFSTRGPATLRDFVWWSGLSTADARRGIDMAATHLSSRSIDGRTCWFREMTAPRVGHRVDLVQCYDEAIISYSESRDVLQTAQVDFAVPGYRDGYTHVVLLDGRLAGHWRPVLRKSGWTVETRIRQPLDRVDQRALDTAIKRYSTFRENSTTDAEQEDSQ
jgi:hypothetical protein